MATLKDLASQYGLEDYKQLLSGYPNATKFANALQSGIESHIPTTEDLQSPERMGEWSLSAALNQPTGLTFIGKNAQNWDAQAAKLAEEKLNAGADPAEVWREHLIGRMPDKTLFSEISDKDALYHQHGKDFYDSTFNKMDQLLKNGRDTAGDPLNAQDMLAHPNFYENYPNLKTTELRYLPETSTAKGAFGYFADNGDPVLSVHGMLPNNEAKSTMLHELQHAVQGKEGWGSGGSPEYFTKQKEAERARDILNWRSEVLARKKKYPDADRSAIENNIIQDYSDMGLFKFLPERDLREMATQPYLMYPEQYSHGAEELEKLNNLVKEYGLDKRTTPYKPFEAYQRLAGEAQARATQDRLNMDMAQRRENYPLAGGKLSDIPLDELIYKYEGSGPSLSTDALSKYKDYVGEHTAPLGESGVPLHDLTANDNSVYPSDVYSPQANQYYGSGEPEDAQLFAMAKRLKDKPNEKVTIYRAVPKVQSNSEKIAQIEKDMAKYLKTGKMPSNSSFSNKSDWYDWASDERDRLASLPEETIEPLSINHGDWVALDRKYAKEHGESALRGNYKILSKKVPARQLFTNGDSIREWGWDSRYAKGGSVDIMSKLDTLAGGGDYLADLEQLKRAYPNAEKFITGLKDAAVRSVPTTEQMRDPNFIIDTAGLGGAIKAYHGTPHLFDRFDMSKIGTGEGAQAYGHGLYFAQDPSIASWYAQTLSEQQPSDATLFLGKKPLNLNKIKDDEIQGEIQRIFDYVDDAKYPTDDLESFMRDISEKSKDDLRFYDPTDEEYKQLLYRQKLADALINHGRIEKISNPPHIYETSIEWPSAERETMDPLGEHHLLDWDQPAEGYVQEAIPKKIRELHNARDAISSKYVDDEFNPNDLFSNTYLFPSKEDKAAMDKIAEKIVMHKNMSPAFEKGAEGSVIYSKLVKMLGSPEKASEYLHNIDIPGIKYLDATSRGNDRDMRNYVMFGDEYPQIVKRANSLDELQEKYAKGGSVDKDSLQLNKPQRTPNHPTKSHIVKTMVDGKEKIIRFGEQGAETAGKPKEGESARMTAKREAFKARHAKNIAKGPSSAAYWADKVKWAEGGEVDIKDKALSYLDDLAQLKKAYPNANKFMSTLKDAAYRSVPTTEQMMDPEFILENAGFGGLSTKLLKPIKASEAYGRIEGRPLYVTQADRTKVGGKFLGGPGFSSLQLEDPEYAEALAAWAVQHPSVASTIINGSKQVGEPDPVFTTFVGAPDQHRSNQMVFDYIYDNFKKASKKSDLFTPEKLELMNERLANYYKDKITKENLFPENINILDKNLKKHANTFDKRAAIAEVIGGKGIGGKKGQIIDYDKLLKSTSDPSFSDVPSGSLGNRLFTLNGNVLENRHDLHPAFPTILQGEDLGLVYQPVPRELVMKDFYNKIRQEKGREPGYFDWALGYPPSQLITEDLLTEMQKAGYAKGGSVKDLHDKYEQSDYGYGNRPDNTKKGLGYFGELVRPDGTGVMTEYSIGVPINGKEIDVPSLVPTLTPDEIRHILNMQEGDNMPRSIVHKAIEHAHKRIDEGKPIFATEEDLYAHGGIVDVLHNDAIEQIMKAFKESMMDDEPTVSIEITTQNTESPQSGKIPTSIAREAKHGK